MAELKKMEKILHYHGVYRPAGETDSGFTNKPRHVCRVCWGRSWSGGWRDGEQGAEEGLALAHGELRGAPLYAVCERSLRRGGPKARGTWGERGSHRSGTEARRGGEESNRWDWVGTGPGQGGPVTHRDGFRP